MTEKPYNFSEEVVSRMEELLAKADNQQDYRRIQTIYFRARYGNSAEQIAARTVNQSRKLSAKQRRKVSR